VDVPNGTGPQQVEAAVLSDPRVQELLGGVTPRKVVVVPGRMVSIVL
jgi:leucyl-tRNA synthetase